MMGSGLIKYAGMTPAYRCSEKRSTGASIVEEAEEFIVSVMFIAEFIVPIPTRRRPPVTFRSQQQKVTHAPKGSQ
jgi:hypothetical protein